MAHLLFDLVSCQSNGKTLNHGGKEYAEAVLNEIIARNFPISGIYNSSLDIDEKYITYCKKHGALIDIQVTSLQEAIDLNQFTVYYSALPYSTVDIKWGNTIFIGNLHGVRPIEAFTDKYEYKYSLDVRSLLKARIKGLPFVENRYKTKWLSKINKLLNEPSFVCITGSYHSKYSLLNYFPHISPDRIKVFYDPLEIKTAPITSNQIEKFYLLVSGNRWLKNTYRGIIALDQLISTGQIKSKVIVTGVANKMRYMKEIKNKDNFIFKGYVSTTELATLYQNAYCLLFLSLSEGFGYPPLEAISRGTPVISSPLTAIYEIYQNSVLYCNPFSIDDIKVKILQMEDNDIYNQYLSQGVIHANDMLLRQDQELPKLVDYILSFC